MSRGGRAFTCARSDIDREHVRQVQVNYSGARVTPGIGFPGSRSFIQLLFYTYKVSSLPPMIVAQTTAGGEAVAIVTAAHKAERWEDVSLIITGIHTVCPSK